MKKKVEAISFSSKDFLSEPKKTPKKRKSNSNETLPAKKIKKTDNERGQMTIFCKSKASFESDLKEKQQKNPDQKQTSSVANSLSVNISGGENLLLVDEKIAFSALLNGSEQEKLQKKISLATKKYSEKPTIVKLQWQGCESATLIGIFVEKKTNFTLSSKLSEAQSFSVSKSLWIASQSSITKLALEKIDGEKEILAIVPDYKGIVRVSLDNATQAAANNNFATGAFGLSLKSE